MRAIKYASGQLDSHHIAYHSRPARQPHTSNTNECVGNAVVGREVDKFRFASCSPPAA